jgi:hypothetical protein
MCCPYDADAPIHTTGEDMSNKKNYRIIVTGSRDWDDPDAIRERLYLAAVRSGRCEGGIVVVHGAGGRADAAAKAWVDEVKRNTVYDTKVEEEPHPAAWAVPPRKGDPAGPRRNEEMAALGADECLAFPIGDRRTSPGTWNCIEACCRHGIPVRIFPRAVP